MVIHDFLGALTIRDDSLRVCPLFFYSILFDIDDILLHVFAEPHLVVDNFYQSARKNTTGFGFSIPFGLAKAGKRRVLRNLYPVLLIVNVSVTELPKISELLKVFEDLKSLNAVRIYAFALKCCFVFECKASITQILFIIEHWIRIIN
jgi:hypothetical protein